MSRSAAAKDKPRTMRCAIYTRKSTEEGLEQDFNSLDAQREACEAYIASQKHEKWILVPTAYDDGGYSGGTMERPAMQRLLAEVKAGRIDVMVVYKVDRLTRSLIDFAKIVEVLDRAGASFVSITQSFNTTSSMGRLTLNVLLSFAQFEREVISERVRDKVAASKAKGIFMGGPVALGYDVCDRKLVANEAEAEVVRHIYRRFLEVRSVSELRAELDRSGVRTKVQKMRDGTTRGGIPFARGPLYHILKNRIYLGEIVHKERSYPGEHDGIVDPAVFAAVQEKLAAGAPAVRHAGSNHASLLAGMVRDPADRPMSPNHASKGGRRYRYYVSNQAVPGEGPDDRVWRVPAPALEKATLDGLVVALSKPGELIDQHHEAADVQRLLEALPQMAAALKAATPAALRRLVGELDLQLVLQDDRIVASISTERLLRASGIAPGPVVSVARTFINIPTTVRPRGHEMRLVVRSGVSNRDDQLIALLRQAHAARHQLETSTGLNSVERRDLTRSAKLAYLAPDIVGAILDGTQPQVLTTRRLRRVADLPIAWHKQRQLLGFA